MRARPSSSTTSRCLSSSTRSRPVADGAPVIRDDKEGQQGNVIYDWEVGDAAGTDRAFAQADVISKLKLHYPRSHPSPIECCGSIADFDRASSKLTVYMTTQGAAHHPGRDRDGGRTARAHDPDHFP